MPFEFPKSVSLSQTPTPIQKLDRISKIFEGPEIYIKRDDLTGLGVTGNKIRKLEFLLAEAQEKECDYIITCGGYQSNHARATAIAAAKLGMKCHVVLRNGMSTHLQGNSFLNRLVGAEIQDITPADYMKVDDIMRDVSREVKKKGHNPYIIPEGGSTALGAVGYVKAAQEIAQQLKSMKMGIDHIVLAVGSGGTHAGLLLGKHLFDLPMQIHGINVCDNEAYFINEINHIVKDFQTRFHTDLQIGKKDIRIIDGYVGKGYGLSSQNEIDIIKRVAQSEGIILDPVYTGKAMFGLFDQIRKGTFKQGERVLFLHTGGIFGLFPKRELFF